MHRVHRVLPGGPVLVVGPGSDFRSSYFLLLVCSAFSTPTWALLSPRALSSWPSPSWAWSEACAWHRRARSEMLPAAGAQHAVGVELLVHSWRRKAS